MRKFPQQSSVNGGQSCITWQKSLHMKNVNGTLVQCANRTRMPALLTTRNQHNSDSVFTPSLMFFCFLERNSTISVFIIGSLIQSIEGIKAKFSPSSYKRQRFHISLMHAFDSIMSIGLSLV